MIIKTLAFGLALFACVAQASGYPERPITIMVPFSAGGSTDVFVRTLAESVSKIVEQPIIVENKPGANGIIAAQQVANAKPDGYTLLMTIAGVFRQPHVQAMSFNPTKDLTYIAMTNEYELSVVVREDSPWKSMKDMVAAAKNKPGSVFYGVPTLLGTQDLAMIDLAAKEQLDWTAVPFKGDTQSLVALVGGDIQASITAGNVSLPLEQDKKVRVIASLNEARSNARPEVSTWNEEGFSVSASSAAGISGPSGMPEAVVLKLTQAIHKALQDPALIARAESMGIIVKYLNPQEYTHYASAMYEDSKAIIAQAVKRQ